MVEMNLFAKKKRRVTDVESKLAVTKVGKVEVGEFRGWDRRVCTAEYRT